MKTKSIKIRQANCRLLFHATAGRLFGRASHAPLSLLGVVVEVSR